MLFRNPPRLSSPLGMSRYLQMDLFSWMQNLVTGLLKLKFTDNFDSFLVSDISISAGQEVDIPNAFAGRAGRGIPSQRIIVRQTGNGVITDGVWDAEVVRLKNNGAEEVVVSVVFLK